VQLLSIWMAKRILEGCAATAQAEECQLVGPSIPVLVAERTTTMS
jgi:hypothetical protein